MKLRMRNIGLAVALALAAGCATQSKNEEAASPQSGTASPSSSSRGAPSGAVRGTPGTSASSTGAGQPGGRSVFFEFDKSNLSSQDRRLVEAHAQYLQQHPDVKVRVEGNADERGSKEYNLALGQRRAESVTKAMHLLGVNDQRLEAVSYGEEKPRAQGHDEKAWAQNRRSDILY